MGLLDLLPDWLTGADVRPVQGPFYMPPPDQTAKLGRRRQLGYETARAYGGGDPDRERSIYSSVVSGIDFVPALGEDVGVHETAEDWRQGNYLSSVLGGLGTVAGTVPIVGDVAASGLKGVAKSLRKAEPQGVLGVAAEEAAKVAEFDEVSSALDTMARGEKPLAAPAVKRSAKHPISKIVPTVPVSEMQATYEDVGKMLPEKRISFEDIEPGTTILPVRGDPTITGKRLLGVGGKLFDKSVDLPGGPGFMRGPQQVEEGIGWASNVGPSTNLAKEARRASQRSGGKPVLGMYMKMSEHSGDYAVHQGQIVNEMYKQARPGIPNAMVAKFDDAMRADWGKPNKKTGKVEFPAAHDWPGMDKLTDEYLIGHPNARKKLVKMMNQKGWQDAGFPDIGYARWAGTEPELLDTPTNTSGYGVIQFDPEGRVTQTPKIPHPTYGQQNYATYVGRTEDIPLDVLYDNYSKNIHPSQLTKFLETKPPSLIVDRQTIDRVMNYLRTSNGAKLGLAGAIGAGLLTTAQADEIRQEL